MNLRHLNLARSPAVRCKSPLARLQLPGPRRIWRLIP